MKSHDLFKNDDDRAVSPVIGVILMVAITVILAAVIGTFVLGLGDQLGDNQPTAQLSVDIDYENNNITIEHNGGDAIAADELSVIINHDNTRYESSGTYGERFTVGDEFNADTADPNGTDNVDPGDDVRIRIIHESSQSTLLDRTVDATDGLEITGPFDLI